MREVLLWASVIVGAFTIAYLMSSALIAGVEWLLANQ